MRSQAYGRGEERGGATEAPVERVNAQLHTHTHTFGGGWMEEGATRQDVDTADAA